jgi:GTP-binding protein
MSNPFEGITPDKIRNIAIIAHVDHGKTTLVDNILKQSGTFRDNENVDERAMDSNDIEKERGITILAKCTAVKFDDYKINIVDTPGHADFGGEVERVLSMVDGVVLLVDAAEGPMPQTKFVLGKALKLGLRPIVIINKIDRQDERHNEVLDEIFDLFCMLNASPEQLDFTYLYASGRAGWAVKELTDERKDLMPLFHAILEKVPSPDVDTTKPFSMLATILHADNFLGRLLTGRVYSGKARVNTSVRSLNLHGAKVEDFRLTKLQGYFGTHRIPIDEAIAGDIVTVAGLEKTSVSDTI